MIGSMDAPLSKAPVPVRQGRFSQAPKPEFDAPNILWYFGALVGTLACLGVCDTVGTGARGLWILVAADVFLLAYIELATWLVRTGSIIPGGVIASWSIVFVPVAAGAIERLIGVWHPTQIASPVETFEWRALILSLLLVVAGIVVYRKDRFPFVFAFVAGGALLSAELLVPVFVSHPTLGDDATGLIVFGLVLLVIGILLDLRALRREGFWFHMIGLVVVAAALAYHAFAHTSWGWQLTLLIGVIILALAAPLRRATWVIFGIIGTYVPITHYADSWFGRLGAAVSLAIVGFGFVALGILFRTGEDGWTGLQFGRAPAPPAPPPAA